nr:hypothetical protein [Tanacetum cinerariifolium]
MIQRGLPLNHFDLEQTTRVFQNTMQPKYNHRLMNDQDSDEFRKINIVRATHVVGFGEDNDTFASKWNEMVNEGKHIRIGWMKWAGVKQQDEFHLALFRSINKRNLLVDRVCVWARNLWHVLFIIGENALLHVNILYCLVPQFFGCCERPAAVRDNAGCLKDTHIALFGICQLLLMLAL